MSGRAAKLALSRLGRGRQSARLQCPVRSVGHLTKGTCGAFLLLRWYIANCPSTTEMATRCRQLTIWARLHGKLHKWHFMWRFPTILKGITTTRTSTSSSKAACSPSATMMARLTRSTTRRIAGTTSELTRTTNRARPSRAAAYAAEMAWKARPDAVAKGIGEKHARPGRNEKLACECRGTTIAADAGVRHASPAPVYRFWTRLFFINGAAVLSANDLLVVRRPRDGRDVSAYAVDFFLIGIGAKLSDGDGCADHCRYRKSCADRGQECSEGS